MPRRTFLSRSDEICLGRYIGFRFSLCIFPHIFCLERGAWCGQRPPRCTRQRPRCGESPSCCIVSPWGITEERYADSQRAVANEQRAELSRAVTILPSSLALRGTARGRPPTLPSHSWWCCSVVALGTAVPPRRLSARRARITSSCSARHILWVPPSTSVQLRMAAGSVATPRRAGSFAVKTSFLSFLSRLSVA